MTEALKASGLAVASALHSAPGRKEPAVETIAFRSVVDEEGDGTSMPAAPQMEDEDAENRIYRVTGLLEKLPVPWQQRADPVRREAPGIAAKEGNAPTPAEDDPTGVMRQEESASAPPDEHGPDAVIAEMKAARPIAEAAPKEGAAPARHVDAAAPQGAAGTGEAGVARNVERHEARRNLPPPVTEGAAGQPSVPPTAPQSAAASPDTGPARLPRAENGTVYAAPAAPNQRGPTIAAQNGKAEDRSFGGGRQESEGGKPSFQVIGMRTVPAPAEVALAGASPTGAALVASLEASSSLASATAEAVKAIATSTARKNGTLHVLKIQLQPSELGSVIARLTISDDQLMVELHVESAEARQRLSADGDSITRALRAHGYDIDRVTVQQSPGSTGAGTNDSATGRDARFQQSAGDGQQRGGSAGAHDDGERGGRSISGEPMDGDGKDAGTNRDLYI